MRLCADVSGSGTLGYLVTVTLEREDGNAVQYIGNSAPEMPPPTTFSAYSPRLFDSLIFTPTSLTWDETRLDTGALFHYPNSPQITNLYAAYPVTLAYFQTVQGYIVTFNFNTDGNLGSIEEPAGRSINLSYDGDHVTSVEDWAGRTHQFTYDGDDNLATIQDPTNAIITLQYDGAHHVAQITDGAGNNVYYTYDDQDRVVSRSIGTDPPGEYSYSGAQVTYIDPLGQQWITTLDQNGNVTETEDPLGATRSAQFNNQGLPTQIVDALGRITTLEYDPVTGRMTSRQDPTGATEQWSWDTSGPKYGNLDSYTDGSGRTDQYFYSPNPQLRQRSQWLNGMSQATNYAYTPWGALQSAMTPMGFIHTYNWDNTLRGAQQRDQRDGRHPHLHARFGGQSAERAGRDGPHDRVHLRRCRSAPQRPERPGCAQAVAVRRRRQPDRGDRSAFCLHHAHV